MNELVNIEGTEISIKEFNGQRVVTFSDIDKVHNRPDGTARRNFASNKDRFKEGEHYFVVTPETLANTELYEKRTTNIEVTSPRGMALITQKGYLKLVKAFNDDLAWEVQDRLIDNYFKSKEVVDERLSPETQLILKLAQSIADKELADKERDRKIKELQTVAEKAVETTEAIKEAIQPVFDNWRDETNKKFNRIQKNCGAQFSYLRNEMYKALEQRAGCDLNTRLRNLQSRMNDKGCTKTEISKISKMDVIEQDKKLREIFSKIVTEYEIRYCA